MLCSLLYFEFKELGDGPFPKKDPYPPNVACQIISISKNWCRTLFTKALLPGSICLLIIFQPPRSISSLKGATIFLNPLLFYKFLLWEMFLESFYSLVGVEYSGISFLDLNLNLHIFLSHLLRNCLLVILLFGSLSSHFLYNVLYYLM